jgi:two-component system nitrate/nitrite response regulator NarL
MASTVYAADDHPLFLDALVSLIESTPDEFELVGSAARGDEALEDLRRLRPDLAVIDHRLPAVSATQIIEALAIEGVPTRVIVVSAYLDEETVYSAIQSGAAAFVGKEEPREVLRAAMAAAARGNVVLSPAVQAELILAVRRQKQEEQVKLTPREQDVLRLAAAGSSSGEIAHTLHLGVTTVKTHIRNASDKLQVSGRTAAVAEALRRHLL